MNAETDTEKLSQRNRELTILNAIAQALNREVDLDQALQTTLASVAALLDLETGWVWLLDEKTGASYLAASQNLPPALADYPRRMEGSCYCLDTYQAGDLNGAANLNVVTCSRLKWLIDGTRGLKYHASIPLYAHGKKLGVLNVASPDWKELSTEDLKILYTIGDVLSMAIERARLFARSVELGAVDERNRLAREIHDTLAQGLSGIVMHLETADATLDAQMDRMQVKHSIQQALAAARGYLEEARRSVLDLRAAPLEGRTLEAALAALAAESSQSGGFEVRIESTGAARPLPVRIEAGLYRIAQEALANIGQHAQATRVTIHLIVTPEQAQLTIEDNGRGFRVEEISEGRFGMIGMSERARLLGGQLNVHSDPGTGTQIDARVPLLD